MNIQSGKFKRESMARYNPHGGSIGEKLLTVVKFGLIVIAFAGLLNGYIYLNQKITETERSIQRIQREIERTDREIAQLRISRERLRSWPHIREMIARFDLRLHQPMPGQVTRMAVLSREQAARVPLEVAVNVPVRTGNPRRGGSAAYRRN